MRKPKPNRTLPRDGEHVLILIASRWRKAVFHESNCVVIRDSPQGPMGYAIRDYFSYSVDGMALTVPRQTIIRNDFVHRPLPRWRPLRQTQRQQMTSQTSWPHIQIMREAAARHGLTLAQLRDSSISAMQTAARAEAAQRLATERGLPTATIARLLCRSIWAVRLLLDDDMRLKRNISRRNASRRK
jgi:hypothetical protein